jgi:hypothetical protein
MNDEKVFYEFTLEIAGDDFDDSECEQRLGLKTTDVWRQQRKELRQRTDIPDMVWSYSEIVQNEIFLGEAIRSFVSVIVKKAHLIKDFSASHGLSCGIVITVSYSDDPPILNLPPDVLSDLSAIGLELSIILREPIGSNKPFTGKISK